MLLNMMCGRRLSAISLCLAVTFAPLFNAQADEPEVIPGDSPVAVSEQGEALPQAQATAIMAGSSHCLKVRLKSPHANRISITRRL